MTLHYVSDRLVMTAYLHIRPNRGAVQYFRCIVRRYPLAWVTA
jgi:hypothetical protein